MDATETKSTRTLHAPATLRRVNRVSGLLVSLFPLLAAAEAGPLGSWSANEGRILDKMHAP